MDEKMTSMFSAPEGYFDSLEGRLSALPAAGKPSYGTFRRVRPYIAVAAGIAMLAVVWTAVLRPVSHRSSDQAVAEYVLSDDDIFDYLLGCGYTSEQL